MKTLAFFFVTALAVMAFTATFASACGDWLALVSPEYYRGLHGETAGPYDLVNPCWIRGMIDRRPVVTSCPAGNHDVGGGKCCEDGTHAEGTKCILQPC